MSVTYSCIREYFILEENIFWGNGGKDMNSDNKELGLILFFFSFPIPPLWMTFLILEYLCSYTYIFFYCHCSFFSSRAFLSNQ